MNFIQGPSKVDNIKWRVVSQLVYSFTACLQLQQIELRISTELSTVHL